ncbi:type II secretion system GspH family protein [Lacticaseibacillus casei]|jgi:competence protein ComGC|uniref:Type II secretion system protein n=1 Tax=Lacticaseibacillus huelsenbergensis TaxID=3035291 RepID=A0ABY8DNI7_9LACO|nr:MULTISPECIES: type II secretion system protein [Lacticaseibacillus]MDG3062705.1 type II secretion system protein [Lacticaseibacillus sp. BCRC 81376]QVI38170.1 type II secretion system protein [Lacticaseibacillus casei]QXG59984.1 type II secretion system GspH family protein [Lacticaseibacillus casei]WFB38539.1 type II secretion system protein [Lacticaseibacillus huelsenbergensis]WFB42964.1 type II secretion system protein [Lacticaseibacillus huelsenbergensis]
MRRKKLRAFTLIEVVAALGVIILLTLALVLTIQGQMKRVDTQNLKATVATVNTQLEMTYNEPDQGGVDFSSADQLVKKDVISQSQADALKKGGYKLTSGSPPKFAK